MLRFIAKLLKILFIFILFIWVITKVLIFVSEKSGNNYYPDLSGYSYLKVEKENNFLDYDKDEFIFTKKMDAVNENDIIVFLNKNYPIYAKVNSVDKQHYSCTSGINNEEISVEKQDYMGTVIYTNKELSKYINFFSKPLVVLFMLVYCVFIDQFTYKRF